MRGGGSLKAVIIWVEGNEHVIIWCAWQSHRGTEFFPGVKSALGACRVSCYTTRAIATPDSGVGEKNFLLAPRMQWADALRIAMDIRWRTKLITREQPMSHFVARRAARRFRKCWPSWCIWIAPSIEYTNGVKSALRSAYASLCLLLFIAAADSRTARTGRLTQEWASVLTILKSNSTCVCGFQTSLTAWSHTKPPSSLGPVCCSRTTGSGVTWQYAMEANCPATSRTSLWRRMMFPPFGQLSPWSSEKLFPQPSHTPGRANRGLLHRKATPSRNSGAERIVSFFSLGVADSHAPVEKSFEFLRLRCVRSRRAGELASNFLKDSSLRLDHASPRALKMDSRWVATSNSSAAAIASV